MSSVYPTEIVEVASLKRELSVDPFLKHDLFTAVVKNREEFEHWASNAESYEKRKFYFVSALDAS